MPLRRTERSTGRDRPRWKDGSHDLVENTHANESRCETVLEPDLQTEPLVNVPQLLARTHEHEVSTRDRPARTGADARIEESAATGEVCLALRPYGRASKLRFRSTSEYRPYVKPGGGLYHLSTGQRGDISCWRGLRGSRPRPAAGRGDARRDLPPERSGRASSLRNASDARGR